MKVYRRVENIYRTMVFCRTDEGVSAVSVSEVLVMIVILDSESEERYVFCTDLQNCQ
jgi:hypothetical protein